ncbi:MAG: RAMP superfamily CRISPR-associated protein [Anaerolineales bacterium]
MPAPTEQREPKPIFWIRLSGDVAAKTKPAAHDRFTDLSGRLEIQMKVVSEYLYVGSGEFGLFGPQGGEQAYHTFARRNGQLIIPATSIKGAVRSIVEAISNSCVRLAARGERVPRSYEGCKDTEHLCPACRLFGTTGYRGRVHFSDAIPVDHVKPAIIKIADLWPPRLAKGRKFYEAKAFQPQDTRPEKSHRFIEVVPKGSQFSCTLHFENVAVAEMGLVMRALGFALSSQDPDKIVRAFPVKIGGAKPRCLGAVQMTPRHLYLIPAGPQFLSALQAGGVASEDIQNALKEWLAASEDGLLDAEAWDDFRKKARPRDDTELCPKEVY